MNMTRSDKINWLTLIVIAGFIAGILFNGYSEFTYKFKYPYTTFLFRPSDRFSDFSTWFRNSNSLNPYLESGPSDRRNIFPFPFFLGFIVQPLGLNASLLLFLIIFSIFMFTVTYIYTKSNDKLENIKNALIISFLSYPVLFALDRANLEIIIFIFTFLSVYFISKEKYLRSAILLSVPIAFKLIPGLLIVLFIIKKQIRAALISLILACVLTIIPLMIFPGGVVQNINRFISNAALYNDIYVIGNAGLPFGHSIWGLLKLGIILIFGFPSNQHLILLLNFYSVITILILFLIIIYTIFIEKIYWKRVALLILSLLLMSPVSADYKLLHIFIPLYLFLNETVSSETDWIYLILFSLLLIPKSYYFQPGTEISSNVGLNPLIMIGIIVLIIKEGFFHLRRPAFKKIGPKKEKY